MTRILVQQFEPLDERLNDLFFKFGIGQVGQRVAGDGLYGFGGLVP